MKSLQDYIDRYRKVVQNLGYSGESTEVLIQLLANASYISEVENITYMAEASLDKASLINSKIQHCVDTMYSVFRGSCPRVMMKIKPTKYLTFNPYDLIVTSNNFSIYYLGYYSVNKDNTTDTTETDSSSGDNISGRNYFKIIKTVSSSKVIDTTNTSSNQSDSSNPGDSSTDNIDTSKSLDELLGDGYTGSWNYSSATFYPAVDEGDNQIILGFIAPKRIGDNLSIEKEINSNNTYFVECTENNLSDDMYVEIVQNDESRVKLPRTRVFAEHILDHKIFDLTIPSFGSRLYLANYFKDTVGRDSRSIEGMTENTRIVAQYFGYSELDDYNENELKRVQLKGAELLKFSDKFLKSEKVSEISDGLCYVDAIPRDNLNTIHYKANRDRYVSSIIRSNSDIGTILEETYPELIRGGSTSYLFTTNGNSENKLSTLNIYYIPKEEDVLLSASQIQDFIKEKRAYYVITDVITISPGEKYIANFDISLELYKNSDEDWSKLVGEDILVSNYEKKFNINFNESTQKEIESLISKLSNVKKITGFSYYFTDSSGQKVDLIDKDMNQVYFEIKYAITASITQTS